MWLRRWTRPKLSCLVVTAAALLWTGCDDDDGGGNPRLDAGADAQVQRDSQLQPDGPLPDGPLPDGPLPDTVTHKAITLNVAHLGDTHAQVEAHTLNLKLDGTDTQVVLGGFPRLVSKIADLRTTAADTLVLHAGDAFQGSLYFTKYLGLADLEFFEMMAVDAMVVGNHEFDRGPATLADFIDEAAFPVLGANVDASGDTDLAGKLEGYTVKTIDGEQVAILGLTTAEIPTISSPGDQVTFSDHVQKAQALVTEIEALGINKIIALTHIGYEADLALAQAVDGIDVIIGGHSHTFLGDQTALEELQANVAYGGLPLDPEDVYPKVVQSSAGNDVCIAHAWYRTLTLGTLQIEVDEDGFVTACQGNPVLLVGDTFRRYNPDTSQVEEVTGQDKTDILDAIDASAVIEVVAEDSAALTALSPLKTGVDEMMTLKIADVAEDLIHVYIPGPHFQTGDPFPKGSHLAPHVAESMLAKLKANGIDAQITVINAGGVRKDLLAGDLSVGDVYEMCPFENTLVVFELTGQQIKDQLEQAVTGAHENPGEGTGVRFPYVGGLRYTADMTQNLNQRITSVEVRTTSGWATLEMATTYTVGTSAFLAGGGDGYDVFKNASRYDSGFIDTEAFIEYAEDKGTLSQPADTGITYVPPPT